MNPVFSFAHVMVRQRSTTHSLSRVFTKAGIGQNSLDSWLKPRTRTSWNKICFSLAIQQFVAIYASFLLMHLCLWKWNWWHFIHLFACLFVINRILSERNASVSCLTVPGVSHCVLLCQSHISWEAHEICVCRVAVVQRGGNEDVSSFSRPPRRSCLDTWHYTTRNFSTSRSCSQDCIYISHTHTLSFLNFNICIHSSERHWPIYHQHLSLAEWLYSCTKVY